MAPFIDGGLEPECVECYGPAVRRSIASGTDRTKDGVFVTAATVVIHARPEDGPSFTR